MCRCWRPSGNQSLAKQDRLFRNDPKNSTGLGNYTGVPRAITNLEKLVQGFNMILTQLKLPRFNPQKPAVELRELAQAGLLRRTDRPVYQERLEHN